MATTSTYKNNNSVILTRAFSSTVTMRPTSPSSGSGDQASAAEPHRAPSPSTAVATASSTPKASTSKPQHQLGKSHGGFHPFGVLPNGASSPSVKTSPTKTKGGGSPTKRTKSNVETLRAKKQTLDQNIKQIFRQGTNRFTAGGSNKGKPQIIILGIG